jgi:hypothetical protein
MAPASGRRASSNGAANGIIGDGVHSAAVAAGFAAPAQLLTTRAFRSAVAQQAPVRQADLVRAGMYSDANVRTHELFVLDRLARRKRMQRLIALGAAGVAVLLLAGGIGRLAYRQEGPFAPRAEVVLSVSPGGDVFLDDKPIGTASSQASLKLRAGRYRLEVRHGEDPPFRQELNLAPGERIEVRHVFTPLPQMLFEVSPAGGEILVDGAARGVAGTLERLEVKEGTHTVEIRYGQYPPYRAQVTLKRGQQVKVKHVFTPAMLLFRVVPGGQVFVDGKPRGTLPGLRQLELGPGRYVVEVRYGQHEPYRRTVQLKAGQRIVIEHEFRENFLQRLFKRKK